MKIRAPPGGPQRRSGGRARPRGGVGRAPWRRSRRRSRRSCPWRGPTGKRRGACAWWPTARLRSPPRPHDAPGLPGRRRAAWGALRPAAGRARRASRAGATDALSAWSPPVRTAIIVTGTASTRAMTTTKDSQSWAATQTRRISRNDGGRGRLGQVAGVVGVERAQSPGGGQRQLARPLPAEPARPESQRVLPTLSPQCGDDAIGGAAGRERSPAPCSAARTRMASPSTTMAGVTECERCVVQQGAVDDPTPAQTAWTTIATALTMASATAMTATRRSPGTRAARSGSTRRGRLRGGCALTG